MTYELRFIARCEELGEAAVRDKVNTGPQLPLGTVLRAATLMLAATALFGLTGCKSLPTGSFELLNTPAMKVAKLTPPITVSVEDRRAFIKDNDVVGMAISGGGMRASAFTLGVFAGLEEITKKDSEASALDRVDFASANSGGSWALAALLANLRADPAFSPRNDYQHYADTFKLLNKFQHQALGRGHGRRHRSHRHDGSRAIHPPSCLFQCLDPAEPGPVRVHQGIL